MIVKKRFIIFTIKLSEIFFKRYFVFLCQVFCFKRVYVIFEKDFRITILRHFSTAFGKSKVIDIVSKKY